MTIDGFNEWSTLNGHNFGLVLIQGPITPCKVVDNFVARRLLSLFAEFSRLLYQVEPTIHFAKDDGEWGNRSFNHLLVGITLKNRRLLLTQKWNCGSTIQPIVIIFLPKMELRSAHGFWTSENDSRTGSSFSEGFYIKIHNMIAYRSIVTKVTTIVHLDSLYSFLSSVAFKS